MTGLQRLRDVNDAYELGQTWWQTWRKVPAIRLKANPS